MKMAEAARTGRTFGGSRRQCRTFSSNRCPFDDVQMNEIITNIRNMLTGRGYVASSASKTTTTVVNELEYVCINEYYL
jgi:heterodisulfide reductase subunit C